MLELKFNLIWGNTMTIQTVEQFSIDFIKRALPLENFHDLDCDLREFGLDGLDLHELAWAVSYEFDTSYNIPYDAFNTVPELAALVREDIEFHNLKEIFHDNL